MGQNSISLELKKQITPSIFIIGQEYYNKSLGNITALRWSRKKGNLLKQTVIACFLRTIRKIAANTL